MLLVVACLGRVDMQWYGLKDWDQRLNIEIKDQGSRPRIRITPCDAPRQQIVKCLERVKAFAALERGAARQHFFTHTHNIQHLFTISNTLLGSIVPIALGSIALHNELQQRTGQNLTLCEKLPL